MSVSKRRMQKSLNQSNLSELSISQNMRESALFKNYALADIQNTYAITTSNNESKSSRKQIIQPTPPKKKNGLHTGTTRKQQTQHKKETEKYKQNRSSINTINYAGISKVLEDKNLCINNQEKQIQSLKMTLDKVKKELQLTRADFERAKLEDLGNLKKNQKDNEENVRELEVLRVGMRQLKSKIEGLQQQKSQLQKKAQQYFSQNQELTIKLTAIKQELSTKQEQQQKISCLNQQLLWLKQQQKQSKQVELQKQTIQQRCRNLQKKLNQYILRYNQIQTEYNQSQIKYYRAQKQNDDLKLEKDQAKLQCANFKYLLDEERKTHDEVVAKWRARIARLEDMYRGAAGRDYSGDYRGIIADVQGRCIKLEHFGEMEAKLEHKNMQISSLKAQIKQLLSQIEALSRQLSQTREQARLRQTLQQQLASSLHLNKQSQTLKSQLETFKQTYQKLQQQMTNKTEQNIQLNNKIMKLTEQRNILIQQKQQINIQNISYVEKMASLEGHVVQLQCQVQKVKGQCLDLEKGWKLELDVEKGKCGDLTKQIADVRANHQCKVQQWKTVQMEMETRMIQLVGVIQNQRKRVEASENQLLEMEKRMNTTSSEKANVEQQKRLVQQQKIEYNQRWVLCQDQLRKCEQMRTILSNQKHSIQGQLCKAMDLIMIKTSQVESLQKDNQQTEKQLVQLRQEIRQKQCHVNNLHIEIAKLTQQATMMSENQRSLLKAEAVELSEKIRYLESELDLAKLSLQTTVQSLQSKLEILELSIKQLKNNNYELNQSIKVKDAELLIKNNEIARLEGIVGKTNGQLKQIKIIVQSYKDKIEQSNQAISQSERRLQAQAYIGRQSQLKWQQQICYFKSKYEQNFKQNMELSTTIQCLQQKLATHASKITQTLKINTQLENQRRRIQQSRYNYQLSKQKQIDGLLDELRTVKEKLEFGVAGKQIEVERLQIDFRAYKQQAEVLAQQHRNQIDELKLIHQRQIKSLQIKLQQQQKQHSSALQTQSTNFTNKQRNYEQKLSQSLTHIQNLHELLTQSQTTLHQKQQQLESLHTLQPIHTLQMEQLRQTKQYNTKLLQQSEEAAQQLNRNYHQLRQAVDQCHRYRSTINVLEREVNVLQSRNVQMANQINVLRCEYMKTGEERLRVEAQLKLQVSGLEQKVKLLNQQIGLWTHKYQSVQKQLKKSQYQCSKVSRSYMQQSNRKNKQNSRELQTYRTQIKLLQEQNLNLQRVMDKELGKRKLIIQELIQQKKVLYEQISH